MDSTELEGPADIVAIMLSILSTVGKPEELVAIPFVLGTWLGRRSNRSTPEQLEKTIELLCNALREGVKAGEASVKRGL